MIFRRINADGKNAAALIRQGGVPLSQFLKYCESRRQSRRVDEMVIIDYKNIETVPFFGNVLPDMKLLTRCIILKFAGI